MKKNFIFAAALMLFAMAVSASAQKATDFSGTWNLDLAKSKLSDREKTSIESQTLIVTQTATELKVETTTKRAAPPAGAPAGGPPAGGPPPGGGGGRMGGGGMMGGGDGTVSYALDGKEVKTEMSGQMGTMQISTKAKLDGGKLEITRTVGTPMGDRVTTEKWWLNADGTLSVESQRPNRDGGTDTTTKVYVKK
ncbi:MAG TPA: hypothetical protein PLL77_05760 [Pyrinomonadaceae bacterium]|nr:hypothetical protein [Pyrinomonadaceae bacterium]